MKRNALLSTANVSWGGYAFMAVMLSLLLRIFTPNIFWSVLSPVLHSGDILASRTHLFLSSFGDTASLSLENERLKNENVSLANENRRLTQKAASLEALGGSESQDSPGIVAGVVARPPTSPYDTLVLSEGESGGVELGMEAFAPGDVPIGVVSSVLTHFSRVTLFSAPHMAVDGSVGHSNLPIVLRGAGAGVMRASVGRSAPVNIGDEVFAPGPGLLRIGTVIRIDNDPSSPSLSLQIQPVVNLFSVASLELRTTGPVFAESLFSATSTP